MMAMKPWSLPPGTSVLLLSFQLFHLISALQLCFNSEAPTPAKSKLPFCSNPAYTQKGCCSLENDNKLRLRIKSMNITDQKCGKLIKHLLCAQCDQYAAYLYGNRDPRSSPTLCGLETAFPLNSSSYSGSNQGYCFEVWEACKYSSIADSPFSPRLVGILPSPSSPGASASSIKRETLSDEWQSEKGFCQAFGTPLGTPPNSNFCFEGGPYQFPVQKEESPPQGVCLEKLETGSYISMIPHPDGSDRVFLASQSGKVWLATLPKEGSGYPIQLNTSSPFLDISNRVVNAGEFGLLAVAFHPNFLNNGRMFVSFNCDKTKSDDCAGKCSCNTDVGCDPSQLGTGSDFIPCQYSNVISEFSVNDTNQSIPPAEAVSISGREVRRIITVGLPYTTHHAGQILFGPEDNYLYYMLGDGGSTGDPFNFAQKKKSLLGKILRLDVDNLPSIQEINDLNLWGNYSVPESNPFINDNQSRPEIWALGFRNPWRCSFDSLLPSYFFCADVGEQSYEEVNLITKGGNYGWRIYEGPVPFNATFTPGGSTDLNSVNVIFPIMGYSHKAVDPSAGTSAVIGGYVSRSQQDPCIYGRYMYADLYGSSMWAGTEFPLYSGNFTTVKVNFTCSSTSVLPCQFIPNTTLPSFQYILSWGQDNKKNIYVLSYNGIFKVIPPSSCNFQCKAQAQIAPVGHTNPAPPSALPSPHQSNGFSQSSFIHPSYSTLVLVWLFFSSQSWL